jgi:predicted nucleotidyltransferase
MAMPEKELQELLAGKPGAAKAHLKDWEDRRDHSNEVIRKIREAIAEAPEHVRKNTLIVLRGSVARREAGRKSDINLYIVSNLSQDRITPLVESIEEKTGKRVSAEGPYTIDGVTLSMLHDPSIPFYHMEVLNHHPTLGEKFGNLVSSMRKEAALHFLGPGGDAEDLTKALLLAPAHSVRLILDAQLIPVKAVHGGEMHASDVVIEHQQAVNSQKKFLSRGDREKIYTEHLLHRVNKTLGELVAEKRVKMARADRGTKLVPAEAEQSLLPKMYDSHFGSSIKVEHSRKSMER